MLTLSLSRSFGLSVMGAPQVLHGRGGISLEVRISLNQPSLAVDMADVTNHATHYTFHRGKLNFIKVLYFIVCYGLLAAQVYVSIHTRNGVPSLLMILQSRSDCQSCNAYASQPTDRVSKMQSPHCVREHYCTSRDNSGRCNFTGSRYTVDPPEFYLTLTKHPLVYALYNQSRRIKRTLAIVFVVSFTLEVIGSSRFLSALLQRPDCTVPPADALGMSLYGQVSWIQIIQALW